MAMSSTGRQREVQREIETFLRALSSYPDRFARNPYLSFEQHFFSIAGTSQSIEPRRREG